MTQIKQSIQRCGWCSDDPLYQAYHDHEWGIPCYERETLFELLCLEGQQAGLSWITVLKKRENYRQQFFHHRIEQIAAFTEDDLAIKVQDAGLIRHIGKLTAIRDNAKAWLNQEQQGINMVEWLWTFVDGQPIDQPVANFRDAPTTTTASKTMSKALKKMGFRFVGETTCYAFMQACGMVNDHEISCSFRHHTATK